MTVNSQKLAWKHQFILCVFFFLLLLPSPSLFAEDDQGQIYTLSPPGGNGTQIILYRNHTWKLSHPYNDSDYDKAQSGDKNLKGANLKEAPLNEYEAYGIDLRYSILDGIKLINARLPRANLTSANIVGGLLYGAILNGAMCECACFDKAFLQGADLRASICSNAYFRAANLTGGNLTQGNFSGSHFENSNLTNANMTGAFFTGTVLTSANLTGANLSGTLFKDALMTHTKVDAKWKGYIKSQGVKDYDLIIWNESPLKK
jgi:hypothetical protein